MDGPPSITDGVHRKGNFLEIIPVFSTFKKIIIKAILCNFSMRLLKNLKKKKIIFFASKNIKKLPSKVAHNPTRPPVFSPASFFFVKLRQF